MSRRAIRQSAIFRFSFVFFRFFPVFFWFRSRDPIADLALWDNGVFGGTLLDGTLPKTQTHTHTRTHHTHTHTHTHTHAHTHKRGQKHSEILLLVSPNAGAAVQMHSTGKFLLRLYQVFLHDNYHLRGAGGGRG
jgi:hypothetical protein